MKKIFNDLFNNPFVLVPIGMTTFLMGSVQSAAAIQWTNTLKTLIVLYVISGLIFFGIKIKQRFFV